MNFQFVLFYFGRIPFPLKPKHPLNYTIEITRFSPCGTKRLFFGSGRSSHNHGNSRLFQLFTLCFRKASATVPPVSPPNPRFSHWYGTREPDMKCSCLVPFYRLCFIGFLLTPSRQISPALPSRLSPALSPGTHHNRQPSKPRVPASPPSTPSHASPRPLCRSVLRHQHFSSTKHLLLLFTKFLYTYKNHYGSRYKKFCKKYLFAT